MNEIDKIRERFKSTGLYSIEDYDVATLLAHIEKLEAVIKQYENESTDAVTCRLCTSSNAEKVLKLEAEKAELAERYSQALLYNDTISRSGDEIEQQTAKRCAEIADHAYIKVPVHSRYFQNADYQAGCEAACDAILSEFKEAKE